MSLAKKESFEIVVFASGEGSLFEAMVSSQDQWEYKVVALVTNTLKCGAVEKARHFGTPVFRVEEFLSRMTFSPDLVFLAGYLKLVPSEVLKRFPGAVLNSHPSLLPKHGGQGMYGRFVHEAVIRSGDKVTGFTVHLVNEKYDEGKIVFQETIPVQDIDTPESLAERVKARERQELPRFLGRWVQDHKRS